MRVYQQHLAAAVDEHCPSINGVAQEMIREIVRQIKLNKSARRDGTLVHGIAPETYSLPKSVNVEKLKTKWEKFAESKGIKNRKRSGLVYSEELKKWIPRWGGGSMQNMVLQSGVTEVEQSISKMKKEKQKRVAKNTKNRERNRKKADM